MKFAGGPGARIVIAAAADADSLVVSVTDNGPGVPERARETVFEKFRQMSASPARKPSGTGLGLPICRQIVEHFGGRIWVDSAYRDGARFCFSLPRYRGGAGEATAAE